MWYVVCCMAVRYALRYSIVSYGVQCDLLKYVVFLIDVCALTLLVVLCVVCCMMAVGCCLLETYIPPPSDMKK